jgi:DNA (cytosine-5)-methyltransferase 1
MTHLGDITKIQGYAIPAVDCIIGGSPCQDLSVAGKRAGLAGERSGLFMEQIRVIKEMRQRDKLLGRSGTDIRPRFMVWENVPGAFSSNGGKDFAAVLEETVKVICPEAPTVPVPQSGGGMAKRRMPLRCAGQMEHCLAGT